VLARQVAARLGHLTLHSVNCVFSSFGVKIVEGLKVAWLTRQQALSDVNLLLYLIHTTAAIATETHHIACIIIACLLYNYLHHRCHVIILL
jgi:hypothetical protein